MSGNYDSYRPSRQDPPGPPAYSNQPPLPSGPPPPSPRNAYRPSSLPGQPQMHRFGGGSWSPPRGSSGVQAANEFSFRGNASAPRFPDYQGNGQPQRQGHNNNAHPRQRGRGAFQGRPRPPKIPTYDRPLLNFKRGQTPEQLAGMNGDETERKFIDVDDVSDSDEQSMLESEPEDYEPPAEIDDLNHPVTKRVKLSPGASCQEQGQPAPKWSNPDPYTVLPPIEDTERKKRDVVKLIRKARIAAETDKNKASQAAPGDDFISFGFDDDDKSEDDEDPGRGMQGDGMPGAPVGPREAGNPTPAARPFSHLRALHGLPDKPGQATNEPTSIPDLPPLSFTPPDLQDSSVVDVAESVAQKLVIGGKRKRFDDDVGNLIAPKNKKGRGQFSGGSVLPEWADVNDTDPLPWVGSSHLLTVNSGFRLHKEICDFYEFVRPRDFEQSMRASLLDRLQTFISQWNRDCTVHSFGSYAAKLYLPNADMDLVVVSKRFMERGVKTAAQSRYQMQSLGAQLERARLALPGSVEIITKAKVPLVKYIDNVTRLRVDMSFENSTGIIANETFNAWKAQYPAMPILVTIIKQFLLMRGLNNVATGGLGGFSVTCLVTSLLQNMPRLQLREFIPENHLGELLLEFLDLYGNRFDIDRAGISMDPPGFFDKRVIGPPKFGRLCILDPNQQGNDISGGSREIPTIIRRFSEAREQILLAMKSQPPKRRSLLDSLLGGNYNDFLWQRWHLRQLYEQTHGPVEPEYEYSREEAGNNSDDDSLRSFIITSTGSEHGAAMDGIAELGASIAFAETHSVIEPPTMVSQQRHIASLGRSAKFITNVPWIAEWATVGADYQLTEEVQDRILRAWDHSQNGNLTYIDALTKANAAAKAEAICSGKNAFPVHDERPTVLDESGRQSTEIPPREDATEAEQRKKDAPKARPRKKGKPNADLSHHQSANRLRSVRMKTTQREIALWAFVTDDLEMSNGLQQQIMKAWNISENGAIPYLETLAVSKAAINQEKRRVREAQMRPHLFTLTSRGDWIEERGDRVEEAEEERHAASSQISDIERSAALITSRPQVAAWAKVKAGVGLDKKTHGHITRAWRNSRDGAESYLQVLLALKCLPEVMHRESHRVGQPNPLSKIKKAKQEAAKMSRTEKAKSAMDEDTTGSLVAQASWASDELATLTNARGNQSTKLAKAAMKKKIRKTKRGKTTHRDLWPKASSDVATATRAAHGTSVNDAIQID